MIETTHPLEPGRADMEAMGEAALRLAADFVEGLAEAPAVALEGAQELVPGLLRPPGDAPREVGELLGLFRRAATAAVETAGPGYLAYIPGGGLFASALAELLSRTDNRYTGLAGCAPALVAMVESDTRWLCAEFGLPPGAKPARPV